MGAELILDQISLKDAVEFVVDNRGRSAPTEKKGIPLIATNCVSNDNLYPTAERLRYVSEDTYDNWFRAHPQPGDILLTNKGSQNGAVCLVPDPVNFCIAQDMVALRANSTKIYPLYLFAALRSQIVQKKIKELNVDAVIPHFKKTDFDKLFLPLPGRPLQEFIGNLHFKLVYKIELNRQINQTLEEMAQAIFKSWFVDFEPVKAKIEAKANSQDPERAAMCAISGKSDAELDRLPPDQLENLRATAIRFPDEFVRAGQGIIPKGWISKPLYETATFINGAAFKSKDFSLKGEGRPIVKIAELKSGITNQTKFTTSDFPEKYFIDDDEVLYSWSGSPKTSLEVFKWFGGKGWLNQHIFKVSTESSSAKYFVFFLLRQLKPALIAIATDKQTTGLGHVTVADMKRFLVSYPDDKLLDHFGSIIGPLYEKSSILEKQTMVLEKIRDSLLPKLLSGEIDLGQVA